MTCDALIVPHFGVRLQILGRYGGQRNLSLSMPSHPLWKDGHGRHWYCIRLLRLVRPRGRPKGKADHRFHMGIEELVEARFSVQKTERIDS